MMPASEPLQRETGPIQISGGPHDGMQIDLQDRVVALVVITRDGDDYTATWSQRRDGDVDERAVSHALADLLIEAGWVIRP